MLWCYPYFTEKQSVLPWHLSSKTFIWLTQKSVSRWKTPLFSFLPHKKIYAWFSLYFLPAGYPWNWLRFIWSLHCKITKKTEEFVTCLSLSYCDYKELLKEENPNPPNSLQIPKQWWGLKFPRKKECFKFRTPYFTLPCFSAKPSHSSQAACCQEIDSCNTQTQKGGVFWLEF